MKKPLFEVVERDAKISADGLYRYWLSRKIRATRPGVFLAGRLVFIMLNPSTADAKIDDHTIRRCMGFAYLFSCEEVVVVNLFALRSRDPKKLKKVEDPIGPENDNWIIEQTRDAVDVIAAWGGLGRFMGRDKKVISMLRGAGKLVYHLGQNDDGSPKHPLYLPNHSNKTILN